MNTRKPREKPKNGSKRGFFAQVNNNIGSHSKNANIGKIRGE